MNDGFLKFVQSMQEGTMRERRGESMNTEVKDHIIDTVIPGDTGKWETGIKRNGEWIIVEQYSGLKEATRGHTKWVMEIKNNSDCKLKSIDLWGLNG